jgi:hypothetical protein
MTAKNKVSMSVQTALRHVLLQNPGTLSTSAPAVRLREDNGSISRRGTCDGRICAKPLSRRTLPRVRKSAVMEGLRD